MQFFLFHRAFFSRVFFFFKKKKDSNSARGNRAAPAQAGSVAPGTIPVGAKVQIQILINEPQFNYKLADIVG